MKTKLIFALCLLPFALALRAQTNTNVASVLTATVYPGYTWLAGESPTASKLNRTALPTVRITGSLDGSTIARGGVGNDNLAAGAFDQATIVGGYGSGFSTVRVKDYSIGVTQLGSNIVGAGLAGGGGNVLRLKVDTNYFAFETANTNADYTNMLTLRWPAFVFAPALVWTNVFPITNSVTNWAAWTNAGGTNFQFTNVGPGLTATDSLPVFSAVQQSNTTVTLAALTQYLSNLNVMPPYTQARAIWGGSPTTNLIATNIYDTVNDYLSCTNSGLPADGSPAAVTFLLPGTLPITPTLTTNQRYFARLSATNANYFRVFTNWATASANTGWLDITAPPNPTGANRLVVLSNFTSYAADVVAVSSGNAVQTGVYDVWFRTNTPTANYYVTLTTGQGESASGVLMLDTALSPSTNRFRIMHKDNTTTFSTTPRGYVQVYPE